MKNLNKSSQKEWQTITLAVETAIAALNPLIVKWNEAVEALGEEIDVEALWSESDTAEIEAAWTTYTDALQSAVAFAENVRDLAQSYYDDKSERWQNGEKGSEYNLFIEAWGEVADMEVQELSDCLDDVTGELSEVEAIEDGPLMAAPMFPGQ